MEIQPKQIIIIARFQNQDRLRLICQKWKRKQDNYFVLVDYGCKALPFLEPNKILFVCGDFDHYPLANLRNCAFPVYKKKNQVETDTEYALRLIKLKPICINKKIRVYCDGPRDDMYLQIITMISHGEPLTLVHNHNIIFLITESYICKTSRKYIFSLINFSEKPAVIDIYNAKYSIKDGVLLPGKAYISNETLENHKLEIKVKIGRIMMIKIPTEKI